MGLTGCRMSHAGGGRLAAYRFAARASAPSPAPHRAITHSPVREPGPWAQLGRWVRATGGSLGFSGAASPLSIRGGTLRGPMTLSERMASSSLTICAAGGEKVGSAPAPALPDNKPKRKKPLPPEPTFVNPPDLPEWEAWENAVVLIDKPKDWTSFDVCGKLRGTIKMKKVGHAGTLDPMATGLLVVCVGKGTKRVDLYQAMEKVYTGTLRLGEGTPSYDAESDVETVPPMYSAIKIKGERLYKLARRGEEVERPARPVIIEQFDLWRDTPGSQDVHFRVRCSKGTYIRSLAHDLGEAVGSAAHLVALRRESIGALDIKDAWTIPGLVEAVEAKGGPPWRKKPPQKKI